MTMECYTEFAYLYDRFMEDVPYEKWADLLSSLLRAYGENIATVVDLGCGTGTFTELMADKGYEMTGVDLSEDMLSVAASKMYESEKRKNILYINQDMRRLMLPYPADAVISVCDCINYLILDEDVNDTFSAVYDNLKKDGLFIFDFNTIHKYKDVIGDTTIAENREDCSFIWENFYSDDDHINEYDVTFFSRVDEEIGGIDDEGLFRKFSEVHIQRGYTLSEMKAFLEKAAFRFVTAIDENSGKEPNEDSERIYIVARR